MKIIKCSLLALTIIIITSCNDSLVLKKVTLSKDVEIDTLERYPSKSLYFVNLIHNQAFGNFYMNYAVIKVIGNHNNLIYELPEATNGQGNRISKDYIAYVKNFGVTNWGWFYIKNGKIQNDLPRMNAILDSLKMTNKRNLFIGETRGYITFSLDGKVVGKSNYGDFVAKSFTHDFDSLDYNLYRLRNHSLIIASNNGDALFEQKEGVFFIPRPGYGIITKYSKKAILNIVDSVSRLKSPPEDIQVKTIE